MSSESSEPLQQQFLFEPELSRRTFLKGAGLALAATVAPDQLKWLAEQAGEIYDDLASPENIITERVIPLEPRERDTPSVLPETRGEPVSIPTTFSRNNGATLFNFTSPTPLRAEHTNTAVTEGIFKSAGTAVITTAEGLTKGEQAYCTLFKGTKQTVAVGYEGGLFVYEPALSQDKNGTGGEWVRIIAQNEKDEPSAVTSTGAWGRLESAEPRQMLIEKITKGTQTLQGIGYKPWAAVLPSTQMPNMTPMIPAIAPEHCMDSIEELVETGAGANGENPKHYFVTEQGDIIDATHLRAKAEETLSLFTQLYYQQIAGEPSPMASVTYSAGSPAKFVFSVDRSSLEPDALIDTAFAIMTTESVAMEGVSQRYVVEKIIPQLDAMWPSGMSPEDLFTNSLGIVGMLSLIQRHELAQRLEAPLRAIHRNNPGVPTAHMLEAIEKVVAQIKPLLGEQVVSRIAHTFGVRKLETPITGKMPRGMYPLIPTKVTVEDGATPTHLSLQGAGITADNPKSQFKLTHAPAMLPTIEHTLGKIGM